MSSSATPLLSVRDLSVVFGNHAVVHNISFDINPGEKLALVGESGSGKTVSALSLLRLVANAQISGQALFEGCDLLSLSERELRAIRGQDIAMIFQEPMTALNPLMSVGDQIAEVIALKQGLAQVKCGHIAIDLLAETGIDEPQRRYLAYPHQLSGGQRQRAMIAMALACQPKLLLADEPTTALDVSLRGQILDLLDRLQRERGMAVLMITHDLNLVRRFADRVVVMEQGHIVEEGATTSLFEHPQHLYTRRLMASRPERDPLAVPSAPVGATPVMVAKGLRVSYPTHLPGLRGWFKRGEFVAVQGADFALAPGQTLGVMGESGSGKSTLALALLGLLPCQGQLSVAGARWGADATNNKALRKQIQVVFQDPFSSLSPRMTVEEIVGEGLGVFEPQLPPDQRRLRVVQALQDELRQRIEEVHAQIHVDELPSCTGSESMLYQVWENLLQNALHYRDLHRSLVITITGRVVRDWVVYSIEDNGVGIPASSLGHIFSPFFRLDPNGMHSGEGLGLTFVTRILESHRGHIKVESELGKGSRFSIYLPESGGLEQ